MEINSANIKQAVSDGDDFGHEMRVGGILENARASRLRDMWNATEVEIPDHGGTYTDSVTGKPREFDYRCRIVHREGTITTCAVLALECKNLHPSSPLVISGRPRTDKESYYAFVESCIIGGTGVAVSFNKQVTNGHFYKYGEFVGKSLLRLSLKEKDKKEKLEVIPNSDIYDKWSQALASALEPAELACEKANTRFPRYHTLILPVVVVPDQLIWRVDYDPSGSIKGDPTSVDECEYFVGRRFELKKKPFVLTHIHFVTLRGLNSLLSKFWGHASAWKWIFPEGAEEVSAVQD